MQALIDFIPLLLALVAYKQYDIYAATIVLMVTLPLIPLGQKLLGKPVSQVHLWSAGLVLLFGGATLIFRDPRFVMMKPTILYFGLAIAFGLAQKFAGVSLIEKMLGGTIRMEPDAWKTLGYIWAGFFVFLGALNILVATNYSEATWFQFKVWGITGLTFAFIIGQSVWIAGRMIDEESTENEQAAQVDSE
ncbi:MAG: inner membrane-spanning protein YciB [Pseudomonadota bacterium]